MNVYYTSSQPSLKTSHMYSTPICIGMTIEEARRQVEELNREEQWFNCECNQFKESVNRMSVKPRQLQQFKSQQTMQLNYDLGEIVWAKIVGYPWWPGIVHQVYQKHSTPATEYLIKFFGDDSHSTLPSSKLAKYAQNKLSFAKKAVSFKLLKGAIEIAENIIVGKSSIEHQFKKAQGKRIVVADSEASLSETQLSEEEAVKQTLETESTKLYSMESQLIIKSGEVMQVELCSEQAPSNDDRACIEQIEMRGIDEENVVDILESGVLKRYMNVQRDRADRLQRIAKKALLRKYFLKKVPQKVQKTKKIRSVAISDQTTILVPRKKHIAKSIKAIKSSINESQIEGATIRRLHQILKSFGVDSESSRQISVNLVLKLKAVYGLDNRTFQRQFLSLIEWLKIHSENIQFIKTYYQKFIQTESVQDSSKYTQQTAQLTPSTVTIQYY